MLRHEENISKEQLAGIKKEYKNLSGTFDKNTNNIQTYFNTYDIVNVEDND